MVFFGVIYTVWPEFFDSLITHVGCVGSQHKERKLRTQENPQ